MEYIHVVNSSALKHTYFDFLYVINQNKNGKKCVPDIIVPGKKTCDEADSPLHQMFFCLEQLSLPLP